jgi:hypothetical protein
MITALSRVSFVSPLGDQGDRNIILQTLCIANEEWHIEADVHHGQIGDVHLYRNKNHHTKNADAEWQWYAAVPTANIKSYGLAGEQPEAKLLPNGESKAENQEGTSATIAASH